MGSRAHRIVAAVEVALLAAGAAACGSPPPEEPHGGADTGNQGGAGGAAGGGAGGAGAITGPPPPSPCAGGGPMPLFAERRDLYSSPPDELWTLNVTAPDTAALAAVNADVAGAEVAVIVQDGAFGAGATQPNATLDVRGRTTRLAKQKSFQLTLTSHTELWHDQRKINLNKHPFDLARVRNKLAFDLFTAVPHMGSLRTHFVHLIVNGESYGLYTQVEAPDARALAAHGLDPLATLYKPNDLGSWQPVDAATAADPAALEAVVEDKANPDIDRLNRLLAAAGDPALDINDVVARHLQRDNYVAWLAMNVLTGNYDTTAQNFLLYSPHGCEGWYFLPWDYDGAFEFYQQPGYPAQPRYRTGLANWWYVTLHQRFLRDPTNFRDVDAAVTRMAAEVLTDPAVAQRLDAYREVVRRFVSVQPDLWGLPTFMPADNADQLAQWEVEYARLRGVIARRHAEYRASLALPTPIWLYPPHLPTAPGGPVTFEWQPSFLFTGGALSYDLEVSRTTAFADGDLVVQQRGLRPPIAMVALPPGTYYWRVIIRADDQPDVNWMTAYLPGYRELLVP